MIKFIKFGLVCWLCNWQLYQSLVIATTPELHDLELIGDQHYRTQGADPFLVIPINSKGLQANTNNSESIEFGLHLKFLIQDRAALAAPSMQFFWTFREQPFSQGRQLTLPINAGENELYFPLSAIAKNIDKVRIDFEKCECDIRFLDMNTVGFSAAYEAATPPAVRELLITGGGRAIPISDWAGAELNTQADGSFTFAGWDPRIRNSTPLNASLEQYAGFYIDFSYDFSRPVQSYELFWYLAGLTSNAKRSAHFTLQTEGRGRQKIFIPFERIYSKRKLNHLRFDFEACEECTFTLHDSRLVGILEAKNYQLYVPERLYYVHTEPMPEGVLKRAILKKLSVDKGFWAFFILLFVGATVFSYRRYFR